MKDFEIYNSGDDIVAYSKLLFKKYPLELFDGEYLLSNDLLIDKHDANPQGRSAVHFFSYNNIDLVLRHYFRGGLPAKFIRDTFCWAGLAKTRVVQELEMLSEMVRLGLPVPTPAAAHIYKKGLTYQADIVTVVIPEAKTLSKILSHKSIDEGGWKKIGAVIKKFHEQNCNHADLNAHNIMINESVDIYLIDFDKSSINASSDTWKTGNLERLRRSLEKLVKEIDGFNYHANNFSSLLKGYGV